jgi:uncharacterized membrane protein
LGAVGPALLLAAVTDGLRAAGLALGTMVGAGAGALSAKLSDDGINDDFLRSVIGLAPRERCWPAVCRATR